MPAARPVALQIRPVAAPAPVLGQPPVIHDAVPAPRVPVNYVYDDSSSDDDWEEEEEEPPPAVRTPATVRSPHQNATIANQVQHERRIADIMHNLRHNHECTHDRWLWIRGPHQCEECHHTLPQYIFECRQCELQACWRCRKNRL